MVDDNIDLKCSMASEIQDLQHCKTTQGRSAAGKEVTQPVENVIVICKPDCVIRKLDFRILSSVRSIRNLELVNLRYGVPTEMYRDRHLQFQPEVRHLQIKNFLMTGPVIVAQFSGIDAANSIRQVKYEFRANFRERRRNPIVNLVHSSENAEEGQAESNNWQEFFQNNIA